MRGVGFSAGQRFVLLLMVAAIIALFGVLAGVIVTSVQGLQATSPVATPRNVSVLPTADAGVATSTPGVTPTVEMNDWSPVQAGRLLDQIERQVGILRGLSQRASVPLNFVDEREMAALLRELHAGRDLERSLQSYVALGLLADASPLFDAGGVAGIYVPEQGQLYVSTGDIGSGADSRVLLAHAYVHALQDQHFGLEAVDAHASTADARLAVRALVEGDATLLMALYLYEELEAPDWEHLAELAMEAEYLCCGEDPDDGPARTRLFAFPYREGRLFAGALFQAGGWEAIDRAYADLPRSSEQVLHPERYLGMRDDPLTVPVPDLGRVLGSDWELSLRDVMGELVTGLYLGEVLPEETARRAAEGWGGDTFVLWEGEGQVRVWRTIWDSTAEAVEFERALVATVPQRYPWAAAVEPPAGLAGQWWETDSEAACVARVARHVVFVRAPDLDVLARVVEVLP